VACAPPEELGGHGRDHAIVTWHDPDGRTRSERTTAPTDLIVRLAGEHGGEVPGLKVRRMSLEDVYLDLVREAGSPDGSATGTELEGALA
jgi:ABC-2 type transport system ATP-binding protein